MAEGILPVPSSRTRGDRRTGEQGALAGEQGLRELQYRSKPLPRTGTTAFSLDCDAKIPRNSKENGHEKFQIQKRIVEAWQACGGYNTSPKRLPKKPAHVLRLYVVLWPAT